MKYNQKQYGSKGLSGLANLGNTCYMNSVLQCLSHTLPLTHILLNFSHHIKENDSGIANEYTRLLKGLWEENYPVTPISFRKTFGLKYHNFQGPIQQDSQECLAFLLDSLHNDLSRKVKFKEKNFNSDLSKEAYNSYKNFYQKNYSFIVDLFYGQLLETIDCPSCNTVSNVFNPFGFLSVPVGNSTQLSDCIKSYFKKEKLDSKNKWKCDSCKNDVQAKKMSFLWKLPEIVIVHLKRFDMKTVGNRVMFSKLDHFVQFGEYIDFAEYVAPDSPEQNTKFRLYAISCHTGGIQGGHYFSYCRNANGNWYEFDDSSVKQVTRIPGQCAYILFFQRVRH